MLPPKLSNYATAQHQAEHARNGRLLTDPAGCTAARCHVALVPDYGRRTRAFGATLRDRPPTFARAGQGRPSAEGSQEATLCGKDARRPVFLFADASNTIYDLLYLF